MRYVKPAIESERAILGALLLDASLFATINQKLHPSDFYYETHQNILEAMYRLYEKHGTYDQAMLSSEFLFETEGAEYLDDLIAACISTNNINAHIDIVREKSVQRQLAKCFEKLNNKKESNKSITQEAQEIVNGDRAKDYGDMKESFDRIAALWSAYTGNNIDAIDVCKMMILLKVSRAKNNNHRDSYVDIVGYVECADKLLKHKPTV